MKAILKKLALLCVSIIIVLALAEIALRLFLPVYPVGNLRTYRYDPELGARLKPSLHEFDLTDHQEETIVNAAGTANFQTDFSGYKRIVFAVGDSYTQGTGLPADMSYPAQLDMILNRDERGMYSKQFGVVNLGMAGTGGEQELITLDRWSQQIGEPSVIMYLGCDNDREDDLLFESGYYHRHLVDGSPTWGPLVGPLQWLTSDLQLGLRTKLLIAEMRRHGINANTPNATISVAEMESSIIERLREYARQHNALLVVSWSEKGESYSWLKTWAEQNHIQFADWAPRVDSVTTAIPDLPTENHHSGGHHRGWVNSIIAEEYASAIKRNLP